MWEHPRRGRNAPGEAESIKEKKHTSSSDRSSYKDGAFARSEHLQSPLTLTLRTITVDGGCRKALVDQEVRKSVSHALGLDKDQCEADAVGV